MGTVLVSCSLSEVDPTGEVDPTRRAEVDPTHHAGVDPTRRAEVDPTRRGKVDPICSLNPNSIRHA